MADLRGVSGPQLRVLAIRAFIAAAEGALDEATTEAEKAELVGVKVKLEKIRERLGEVAAELDEIV